MTYIVCPTKNQKDSGVFCFAFDSDLKAAKKFAVDVTRSAWNQWREVGSPSGFSGCEGLALYLHVSTNADHTEFAVLNVIVQGRLYPPDHFDE